MASLSFAANYALAPANARDVFASAGESSNDRLLRNAWGYHAANLAIHLLCALCLFGIVRQTLRHMRGQGFAGADVPSADGLALAVALLWVVHPLTTGAVTYIVQRTESLMALFYLLTLYGAIRALSAPAAGRRAWCVLAVLACLLGMGTNEAMVTAPLAVLLWDWIFIRRSWPEVLSRRWPLYLGLAATWLPLGWIIAQSPREASVGIGLQGVTAWSYLVTQAGVLVHYLRLAAVPWPLVLDYEWPIATSLLSVAPQFIGLALALGLAVWGLVRRAAWAFPAAAFFLILGPTSSVIPVVTEVASEQRMYLPLAALVGLAVVGGASLVRRTPRAVGPIAIAALIVMLGSLTYARNGDYVSEERLYEQTLAAAPANARAHNNLATVLMPQRRLDEAESHLRDAVRLKPMYAEAQANLGVALAMQGRPEDALPFFDRALRIQPDYVDAWRNKAEALASLGRFREAVPAYEQVLALQPDDRRAVTVLAWLRATSPLNDIRNGTRAVELARRAIQVTGESDPDTLDILAAAYAESGRFPEAIAAIRRAISLARARGESRPPFEYRLSLYIEGRPFREPPADSR